MRVDTDAEILRLRAVLRDLVALSAIPAVWTGREPPAVAAGLADELVDLLQLDFVFVRLCDPGGAGAVEVTRGDAWRRFPEWLERYPATSPESPRKEIVPDVGDRSEPCRGIAIRIGVDGERGLVAAASERSDFPTATAQLLLSLAANQAATAFRSARLIQERSRVEEELREVRDELEIKVAERTAELRRSETYLAEAQRLTRTGSFAVDAVTREVTHSSDEHSRLYGFDPEQGTPSLGAFLERIHPQDRARCTEAFERGIREATNIEVEYRVVLPQSLVRQHHVIAHLVVDASGELDEIVGTVVDVTERRHAETELERLAGEQAALRRVATLVAREASQAEVFTAIAEEIGQLLGAEESRMLRYEDDRSAVVVARWGQAEDVFPVGSRLRLEGDNASSRVFRTRRPARIDGYGTASGPIAEHARWIGIRSVVATPILVEGRLWGAMVTGTTQDEPLPPETEARLGQFTALMATAIANADSYARADRLAEEQAALRRVATLVAKEVPSAEVFGKVAEETANLLGEVDVALLRDEGDGTGTVVANWGVRAMGAFPAGTRLPIDGDSATMVALREGRTVRIDDYSKTTASARRSAERLGMHCSVAAPIEVRGRIWGALGAAKYKDAEPFPPEAERRIAQLADLVATAIANAEARAEMERLAEEQAALRRVATLVAEGASPAAVFDAVATEMNQVLGAEGVTLGRYEPNDEVTVLVQSGAGPLIPPPGTRVSIAEVVRNVRMQASVWAPIVVEGRIWGAAIANWKAEEAPPEDTQERMAEFAELLDTAIANADSRDQLTASRARLLAAADESRRRVVRDLHDGAQQRLVHTIVTLKLAQQALRADDAKAESLIAKALEHAQQGNEALRELAHGILPKVLTDGGLRAGIETVVSRLDLPVEVDVPDERFPIEVEASAYFIVAEALTNVVKHARAEYAQASVSVEDGMLHVEVRDNGIGGADPEGHGLVGVADRVIALGGRLEIDSPPGVGTVLAATLSLPAG